MQLVVSNNELVIKIMAQLKLENLKKQFAPNVIPVKDISLTVNDGDFITLLGPSGCGKSTLLRLIAGLEKPTNGKVILDEKELNNIPPGDRNMAMVFQSYALYPHMSVFDNIASALKIRKIPPEEIKNRVSVVSSNLGLTDLLNRKPKQLSGGQRQRVALARALVRKPDVFLLDEPLSNLDALLREKVRAELKQLFANQNKPVIYVTHDQTEAMTLSSKVVVLLDGLIQQIDTPDRIYNQPANKFVAGFVGSPQMNLLNLECKQGGALLGETIIPLPKGNESLSEVDLGIRPEDITLATENHTITVTGKVLLTENFGRELLVSVEIPNSNHFLRILINPELQWNENNIKLALNPNKLHWFCTNTGNSILSGISN